MLSASDKPHKELSYHEHPNSCIEYLCPFLFVLLNCKHYENKFSGNLCKCLKSHDTFGLVTQDGISLNNSPTLGLKNTTCDEIAKQNTRQSAMRRDEVYYNNSNEKSV